MLICIRVWIALLFVELVAVLCFVSAGRLHSTAEQEYHRLIEAKGHAYDERVVLLLSLTGRLSPERAEEVFRESPMQPAERGVRAAVERARAIFILGTLRAVRWAEWIPAFAACMLAAAIDGLMVRRRRAFGFATPMPPLYNLSAHLLISALFSIPILLAAPVPIPVMAPMGAMATATAALWVLCAHFPGPATLLGS